MEKNKEFVWFDKTALVTGASGIVGSWLVRALLEKKCRVVAFIRDSDQNSELVRSGDHLKVSVVTGKLEEYSDILRAINEFEVDTVFHLGAQAIVNSARRMPLQTFEANIRGTYNLLEACRVVRSYGLAERIVIASSDKAYGVHSELPYTEEMVLRGRHPYDVSKVCADLIGQGYAETYGLQIGIARSGNVFGGGDLNWDRIVPGTIRSLIRNENPIIRSDGKYTRDYIYVKDLVEGYIRIAERDADLGCNSEAFNFGYGQPVSVLEIVNLIRCTMGREDLVPRICDNVVGEIRDQYLSAAKAKSQLGWNPKYRLENGLEETLAWYRDYFCS